MQVIERTRCCYHDIASGVSIWQVGLDRNAGRYVSNTRTKFSTGLESLSPRVHDLSVSSPTLSTQRQKAEEGGVTLLSNIRHFKQPPRSNPDPR